MTHRHEAPQTLTIWRKRFAWASVTTLVILIGIVTYQEFVLEQPMDPTAGGFIGGAVGLNTGQYETRILLREIKNRYDRAAEAEERQKLLNQVQVLEELLTRIEDKTRRTNPEPAPGSITASLLERETQKTNGNNENLPVFISSAAFGLSVLGFISTSFIAWRSDRRATLAEARAQEEHAWKRIDRENERNSSVD